MTTILGIQHDNGFTIAADKQVTENERPYYHKEMLKITEHGDYVVGGSGSSRCVDSIQYGNWTPPEYDDSPMFGFMVSKVIPSIRKAHDEAGVTLDKEEVFKFIIGLNSRLFYIAEDYSVLISDTPYYGAGTGAQYGVGALAAGATLKEAMKIASRYDINTGGAIQIVKRGK
jgi:ATP-dependent protease HslVU (ClpYQ) peptidase subunit